MSDFLQKMSDSEFADFGETFYAKVNGALATYGATTAQANDLKTKKDGFAGDLTAHLDAQANARSQTQTKDTSREDLEAMIRFLIKQARLNGTSDADLAAAGVPVGGDSGAATTATRPVGRVDTSQRLQHTIHFADEATPDSKRNPRGVFGCEIYQKIGGAPPADLSECVFRALDSKTPYVWEFDAEDVGKMVHYILRWRLRDESASPLSETASATVTG